MKQCPNCKTTYTDESLSFCLDDGARLASLSNDEETLVIPVDKSSSPARFADSSPTVMSPANSHPPIREKRASFFIIAALIGFLLIALVGLAAAVGYFLSRPGEKKPNDAASPTPISITSPTSTPPIDETANLKEKLANLQKQVETQKNQKQITTERNYPLQPQTGDIRRVNSPSDGFLALRAAPNSETGERLAKIPHGASVTVLGCPKSSNVGKIPGRWCQVIYNGQTGWAFDAFLIR